MLSQHGTLEISRSRLMHNLAVLRNKIGPHPQLCATLKANAYGHGTSIMAALLREAGIEWTCVYSVHEAMELSLAYDTFNMLVLAPLVFIEGGGFEMIRKVLARHYRHIRFNITDGESARRLSEALQVINSNNAIPVHIQVDAGLTRLGVDPDNAEALALEIAAQPGLRLEGLFAHFSHGDVPRHGTLEQQLAILHNIATPLRAKFPKLLVHLQNSGGAFHADTAGLDMVRIGIALYGLQPAMSDPVPELLPIAQVTAPIIAIHDRPPGTGVGYGHTFVTARHSRLAVVPVGYGDGYPRGMSNKGVAQVRGVEVPLVGRVSMDQIILDITEVPGATLGDRVQVISGEFGAGNSLDVMAMELGTIGYELATHMGDRLQRVVVD